MAISSSSSQDLLRYQIRRRAPDRDRGEQSQAFSGQRRHIYFPCSCFLVDRTCQGARLRFWDRRTSHDQSIAGGTWHGRRG